VEEALCWFELALKHLEEDPKLGYLIKQGGDSPHLIALVGAGEHRQDRLSLMGEALRKCRRTLHVYKRTDPRRIRLNDMCCRSRTLSLKS